MLPFQQVCIQHDLGKLTVHKQQSRRLESEHHLY